MTTTNRIESAQRAIAQILADLERETGLLVTWLDLERIDVTQLQDVAPRHLMQPRITVERPPGHDWSY